MKSVHPPLSKTKQGIERLFQGSIHKLCVLIILFHISISFVFAQVPVKGDSATGAESAPMEQTIEDAMSDLESDDQTDWTVFTDQLDDWVRKPLDLNAATYEDLVMLPGLSPVIIQNFLAYRDRFAPILSVYELQAVPGFTHGHFLAIRPYIAVRAGREKDIKNMGQHPMGPSLKEILENSKEEITLRIINTIEDQKGYTAPDTSSTGVLSSRYLGDPYRTFFRFRSRYGSNYSFCLVAEKDAGEKFDWNPQTKTYLFDFFAGHFFLKDYRSLKRFVVGDYNIQAGQGLLFSSGLGFGKGFETILATKRANYGIRPYSSVNENQFLRGTAATVAYKDFWFTGFISRLGKDANVQALTDSLLSDVELVSSLQTSGTHRTLSEQADKRALVETMYGARAEMRKSRVSFGLSHYFQHFSPPISASTNAYKKYAFNGDFNFVSGVDFDWTFKNFNLFGEAGRSRSGGTGALLGLMAFLDPKMEISIHLRDLSRDFHSNRAYIFSDRPTTAQNERGMYMGLRTYPVKKVSFSAFFDKYWFPWHRFNVSYPSQGYEWMTQVDYAVSRGTLFYARLRSDHKQTNAGEIPEGQQLEFLIPTSKTNLRLHFQHKVDRNISIKTRVEFSWYKRESEASKGMVLYQDLSWKIHRKFDFTARYAIFDIDTYNARIYSYENDIPGVYSIPAYFDKGSRYYLIFDVKPIRNFEIWVRWSQSIFPKEKTVGSGLDEIQGNTKSELKVQMRYVF